MKIYIHRDDAHLLEEYIKNIPTPRGFMEVISPNPLIRVFRWDKYADTLAGLAAYTRVEWMVGKYYHRPSKESMTTTVLHPTKDFLKYRDSFDLASLNESLGISED